MKKLMLSAAALMCATVMFAQNDPITADDGVSTSPDYVASGVAPVATGANTGKSVQNGNANMVQVRQAGTSQDVYSHQDDGSGLGGNLATIMQTGAVSSASGVANKANLMQSGTNNQSRTKQEGDENISITRQGRNGDDGSEGNKAAIRQGTGQQAEYNYAAIDQDGDNNQARTQQTYDNSDAWTRQTGDLNKSQVVQNAGPNGTDGHSALVEQEGDRNESSVAQSGLGGRNESTSLQIGDDNKAVQSQTTDALAGSAGNRAGMKQGVKSPYNWDNTPLVGGLFAPINGIDSENVPVFGSTLASYGAIGFQTQTGHENAADMVQIGGSIGDSNYGEQDQVGDNNDAAMVQGHIGAGGENYAKQEQDGSSNYAGLAQSGSGMKALQTQYGNDNMALSSQRGESHKVNVHQRGDENWATTAQGGLGNVALVVQYDGQSYAVEQNLDLGRFDISAGGNQADIMQQGPAGDAAAIDCYFDPQLVPPTIPEIPELVIDPICTGC